MELFLDGKTILASLRDAFFMLSPRKQFRNSVMFVVYCSAILTTICMIDDLFAQKATLFNSWIMILLWLTVYLASFAESLAENRSKAISSKNKTIVFVKQVQDGYLVTISAELLRPGDVILCEEGDIIPASGIVIEGVALIDESAVTGESAPVIRESDGERSVVTAGTKVISDRVKIRVTSKSEISLMERIIAPFDRRIKTPNESALSVVLSSLALIFVLVASSLAMFSLYSGGGLLTVPILTAFLVVLMPTTISALFKTVGIAGMDRLISRNVIALNAHSLESAGDIDMLLLDKTGTITVGNRTANEFVPVSGHAEKDFAAVAMLASFMDKTPEGRSIVELAKKKFKISEQSEDFLNAVAIPFSSMTRMSGVDILGKKPLRRIRKGSVDAIKSHVESLGGKYLEQLNESVIKIAKEGATPLLVSDNEKIVGVIPLKDEIKSGIKERFKKMRKMGIHTTMITGDNPLTAAAIAAEAGVDEYIALATPEIKLKKIRMEQGSGKFVAMTGDGTDDAAALAQADVGIAMNTGTKASREAGNMVDLDSNPTKLIDVVEISKEMLMTRGVLTFFSIVADVAKYFVIIPLLLNSVHRESGVDDGPLAFLNVMSLGSSKSAILSAVLFNALMLLAFIPLALRGIPYKAKSGQQILRNNFLIYGALAIAAPLIGIKTIDVVINRIGIF